MKVCVLKVKPPYDFTDDKTGRRIMGFKFTFFPLDMPHEEGALGVSYVVDRSLSNIGLRDVFQKNPVPGIYDLTIRTSYNARNVLVEQIVGISYDRKLVLDDVLKA